MDRVNNPAEWEEAGLRNLVAGPGLKLVEWPERVAEQLPAADLQLFISSMPGPQQEDAPRQLRLRAGSASGRQLAHRLV